MSGGGGGPNPDKVLWPELVGVPATPAVMKILQDRPDVAVEVLPPGFNRKRVRVFIDTRMGPSSASSLLHPSQPVCICVQFVVLCLEPTLSHDYTTMLIE
jgi:hypothetical protein